MSTFIRNIHNVSVLLCRLVCGSKYRRAVFNAAVDLGLKDMRLELRADRDRVHFLMQSATTYSPTQIARTVKM